MMLCSFYTELPTVQAEIHQIGNEYPKSLESSLKSRLNNTPIYLVLQWFDTVEEVKYLLN